MMDVLLALAVGLLASQVGGVLGGLAIGARDLGTQLAALMGFFFGPLSGFLGVAVGVAVARLLS